VKKHTWFQRIWPSITEFYSAQADFKNLTIVHDLFFYCCRWSEYKIIFLTIDENVQFLFLSVLIMLIKWTYVKMHKNSLYIKLPFFSPFLLILQLFFWCRVFFFIFLFLSDFYFQCRFSVSGFFFFHCKFIFLFFEGTFCFLLFSGF